MGMLMVTDLVKVRSEVMHFGFVLQKSWPIFFLELLLSQDHLNVFGGVVGFGRFDIDLAIKFDFQVIGGLFGLGSAGESKAVRFEIELQRFWRNIRHRDCKVDVVFLWLRVGRALSPEHCYIVRQQVSL